MKKKLCMIGCGGIGGYHLDHFLGFTDIVELAGFCDLIPERAEDFVQKAKSGRAFTDFRVMYEEIQPDLVFICIPPYAHGEVEFETIRRGIPFFVEKPLALDLGLAKEILCRVTEKNLITASGFQCRYSNLVPPNLDFVQNNEIVYINCARMGGIPDAPWWSDKLTSGGQIVEQTIHQFDIIRYVYGEPEEVFTFGTRGFVRDVKGYYTDDLSTTVIKFRSGALGTISTGCYVTKGTAYDSKVTFSAKDCRADLKILDTFTVYGEPTSRGAKESGFVLGNDGGFTSSQGEETVYRQEGDAGILCDRTFIEAVISGDGSKIRSPYADALRSLEFTLACNRSMATGKPVRIEG